MNTTITVLAVSLMALAFYHFMGTTAQGYEIRNAESGCATHGGLHHLYNDAWTEHAVCNDGFRVMDIEVTK